MLLSYNSIDSMIHYQHDKLVQAIKLFWMMYLLQYFFCQLSSHMLLSQTCIIASQVSSPNKRVHFDTITIDNSCDGNNASDDTNIVRKKLHVHSHESVSDGNKKMQGFTTNRPDNKQDDALLVNFSSHSSIDYNSGNCNNFDTDDDSTTPSLENNVLASSLGSISTLPLDGHFFNNLLHQKSTS